MATISRKGPKRTEFEIMDTTFSPTGKETLEPKESQLNITSKNHNVSNADEANSGDISMNIRNPTPSSETITPERIRPVDCDTCHLTKDIDTVMFCKKCKQKLCDSCLEIHNRIGGTRTHCKSIEKCWPEGEILNKSVITRLMKEREVDMEQLSTDLSNELGLQVSLLYETDDLEIRAPSGDILELAIDTICAGKKPASKRVSYGLIEWTLEGFYAHAITKLLKRQLETLINTYDLNVLKKHNFETAVQPLHLSGKSDKSNFDKNTASEEEPHFGFKGNIKLTIASSFDNYYAVNCEIEGFKDEVETLRKAEVFRPKHDEFRMKLYVLMKENNDDVLCHMEKTNSVFKLVIQGTDDKTVNNVKQEFLSLFCKECSSCKRDSTRPIFLECKHVLCQHCVTKSASRNDGLRCPICSDTTREKTPVTSLKLRCMQVIDSHLMENTQTSTSRPFGIVRKQSSLRITHVSVKIPKYLLQKWKKLTGGKSRLKSVIENTYGLKVAGVDDNMKIYGQQQEILDLAVQSLEKLNEKTPDIGITQRLVEKNVEWRLRGEHSRIAYFLFNKELYDLRWKFNTVTIRAFTESEPMIVDVRCGYEEFLKVKYEMEELENDIKNLHTDECVQPKNFYHNVKIKEYLHSKRRDEQVYCNLVDKNNVNAVVFRGRKKEFIVAAKEQLMKW